MLATTGLSSDLLLTCFLGVPRRLDQSYGTSKSRMRNTYEHIHEGQRHGFSRRKNLPLLDCSK